MQPSSSWLPWCGHVAITWIPPRGHARLRRLRFRFALPWVFALLTIPLLCKAAEETWQLGLSWSYLSGDFGTGSRTDITYVPLSIRRLFDDGDLTLLIPYVSITGDCGVTLLSGVPNRTDGTCPTTTVTTGSGKQVTRLRATRTTESGIGDLIGRGRFYVTDEQGLIPTVAVTARIKFPTADENQGLGTGEFDKGVGVELSKKLIGDWIGFLDLGYTFIGDPPGLDLNDQWSYDFGAGYYFTKTLLGSLYYEEWRAVVPGFSNPRDLLFAVNHTPTPAARFNAALQIGLSDGAPDYGLTGGLSLRF